MLLVALLSELMCKFQQYVKKWIWFALRRYKEKKDFYVNLSNLNKEMGFPGWLRDPGLIPGLEKSPGEGNGSPVQCSCLKISMDRGA